MNPNPDNRTDNVARIQHNIDMTIENIHRANAMIESTPDTNTQQVLKERNSRREQALNDMINEIKDEANAQKHSN